MSSAPLFFPAPGLSLDTSIEISKSLAYYTITRRFARSRIQVFAYAPDRPGPILKTGPALIDQIAHLFSMYRIGTEIFGVLLKKGVQ
jgi:hypothetical protein